jgi:hypothetical protein
MARRKEGSLVGSPQSKRSFVRPNCRRQDNMSMKKDCR